MAKTRPGPTPLGVDGTANEKVLPSAPVTRVVAMMLGVTGGHPRAELEAELLEVAVSGAVVAVEVNS